MGPAYAGHAYYSLGSPAFLQPFHLSQGPKRQMGREQLVNKGSRLEENREFEGNFSSILLANFRSLTL